MTYTSDRGCTITPRGTGQTYDFDGMPSDGTVTKFAIVTTGVAIASISATSVAFAHAGMKIFGHHRGDGRLQDPDGWSLWHNMLRGDDLINGSAFGDDMRGGSGNDTINGNAPPSTTR